MTLRLYDTSTRSVRDFTPLATGRASIYLCGATVQAPPHIGHIRSGVNFDVLRRWLTRTGLDVTFCRNVTDIDDKVLRVATADGLPWWQVAARNERAFTWAYDVLGCLPPTVEPRATGHIPEMIALIRRLIDRGHGYAAGGDVYFDVRGYAEYGALSGQRIDKMRSAEDGSGAKREPLDFTLWKGAKPGEPEWETPWGPGRPGWHLECSAMAGKYLGDTFDIHGGGTDLIFPHHENEIAQSRAAGYGFARCWLHNGLLTVGGEKMSKSLGNSLLIPDLVTRVRPVELRYYLVGPHYRSMIDFSEDALGEAAAAYRRLEGFVLRAADLVGTDQPPGLLCADFTEAMDDDLGTPAALAAIHEVVREGNIALAAGHRGAVASMQASVRAMLGVLGLDPLAPPWAVAGGGGLQAVIDRLVALALAQRQAARERRDYGAADAIRAELVGAGIVVEDTPQGSRWTHSGRSGQY
ncbi:MAG: cysteine--tRNA ligase [Actinobacteria bacterium]|nr:cysteine--tRNA ligase [Actinomycetota bacterium]MBI3687463.1 cysteine--tRNA ligase [Actinomycetota bacterium]